MAKSWSSLIAFVASVTVCLAATLCTEKEITQENMEKLAKANNYLAHNLYHELSSKSSENIFFSPLSLSTVFGMLYYGTKGDTAKELENTLGYVAAELPEGLVHQTFQAYLTEALSSQDPSAYILNVANSILLDKNMDSEPSYKRDIQDLYQASVKDVDFLTKSQQAVEEVNSWVKQKTNGKIDKLLDDLEPSTIMVILNAVYFKGTWKTQFEPSETLLQTFYNNGLQSASKKVPMMQLEEQFNYTFIDNAHVVELPYKGEDISMLVLLPNEKHGLESLESSLTLERMSSIRKQLKKTNVYLTLPKFKVEYSKEMSSDFQSLGAKHIFAPGADFSGITPNKNVYVSQVIHKAVVEVNEEGSEAAAVTGVISNGIDDDTTYVVVDHPFLFSIVDNRNGMILFAGRVTNL